MSADNGIYIAKFPEGFRVVHAQSIENLTYYPEGSKERKAMLKDYFGNSKVHPDMNDAMAEATKIYNDILNDDFCPIVEYGIQIIGNFESWD